MKNRLDRRLHAVIVRMILQIAVLMSIGLVLSVSVVIKSDGQEKNRKFWSLYHMTNNTAENIY